MTSTNGEVPIGTLPLGQAFDLLLTGRKLSGILMRVTGGSATVKYREVRRATVKDKDTGLPKDITFSAEVIEHWDNETLVQPTGGIDARQEDSEIDNDL